MASRHARLPGCPTQPVYHQEVLATNQFHTVAEIWTPTLLDRQPWDVWEAAGSKTATDRIQAKLRKTLARHTPPPLPDSAAEKIEAILREAEARSGKK
jgi:trimethylamine:corrinoid methyltransferase-like protein